LHSHRLISEPNVIFYFHNMKSVITVTDQMLKLRGSIKMYTTSQEIESMCTVHSVSPSRKLIVYKNCDIVYLYRFNFQFHCCAINPYLKFYAMRRGVNRNMNSFTNRRIFRALCHLYTNPITILLRH
jgi:hypothetical protein